MEQFCQRNRTMLLLKLPDYVYNAIGKVGKTTDARITINSDTQEAILQFGNSLQQDLPGGATIKGKITNVEDLYVFQAGKESASVKASVPKKCNLIPEYNAQFEQYTRNSNHEQKKYATQTTDKTDYLSERYARRTFNLDELHSVYTSGDPSRMAEHVTNTRLKDRRVRGDPEEVRTHLFELFSQQRYWKIKQLSRETGEPDSSLREILSSIAQRVNSGTHSGYWELKREYRNSEQDSDDGEPVKKVKRG